MTGDISYGPSKQVKTIKFKEDSDIHKKISQHGLSNEIPHIGIFITIKQN
jgi:hypothetical protein